MEKLSLKEFIAGVESHTKQSFDINNKRHMMHLQIRIEGFYSDRLRKLGLIEQVLKSTEREDSLYNSVQFYTKKRYN